ncbi:unnamed protein product [Nesidiocoris tenuis]|uniref:Uncharacterized protein n=1 Tax=Nesidiocoris tenuis TaxID=355587 RepID=A0A6H5FTX1_9HEMI|nr:unnamed protein product [Nesidiocoris tenuis]
MEPNDFRVAASNRRYSCIARRDIKYFARSSPSAEPQTKAEDMYSSDGDAQQKDVDMDVEEARYYYGYYRPFPVYYGFRPCPLVSKVDYLVGWAANQLKSLQRPSTSTGSGRPTTIISTIGGFQSDGWFSNAGKYTHPMVIVCCKKKSSSEQHLGPRQITDHEDISATLPSTASYSSGLHPPSERPPRSRLDHSLSDQNQDILLNSFSHLKKKNNNQHTTTSYGHKSSSVSHEQDITTTTTIPGVMFPRSDEEVPVKPRRGNAEGVTSRRQFSREYTLPKQGCARSSVCKMLLSTFGLKEFQVAAWAKEGAANEGMTTPLYKNTVGRTRPPKPVFEFLKEFLDSCRTSQPLYPKINELGARFRH